MRSAIITRFLYALTSFACTYFIIGYSWLYVVGYRATIVEQDDKKHKNDRVELKYHNSSDFLWIKYGREEVDWALVVNAWLCIEREISNRTWLKVYSIDYIDKDMVSIAIKNHDSISIGNPRYALKNY